PFLGMAMALTFYALLRGGFLAGTPGDAKVVNPFGVIAIGALVGMFADKAAQKLGEIFDTLFKSQDSPTRNLTAPPLDKIAPPIIFSDEGPKPVKLIGDKLGKVSKVRLNAIERQPDTVSEKEVVITLQTEDLKPPREVKITAVNPDGETSPAATLRVSDLAITPAALPDARISTAYSQPLAATGGRAPYKWSLAAGGPAWLQIDASSGTLSGTPSAIGSADVTVTVTDATKMTRSKTFPLKVV